MIEISTIKHAPPLVSIIIVNWNKANLLQRCLDSIKLLTAYPNYNVIVVDNASDDGSINLLNAQFPWVNVICNADNVGFSLGNNMGIDYAMKHYRPDFILLLNNDTEIIEKDWLSRLVCDASTGNGIGVIGCKLLSQNGEVQHVGITFSYAGPALIPPSKMPSPGLYPVDAVLGACFLIPKRTIDAIGLLDSGYSPFQHEESDYCARAKASNLITVVDTRVSIVHLGFSSMKHIPPSYWWYVNQRNELRFALLNTYALSLPVWFALNFYRFLKATKENNGKRLEGAPNSVTPKCYWRALMHNLHGIHEILQKRANRSSQIIAQTQPPLLATPLAKPLNHSVVQLLESSPRVGDPLSK